MLTTAVNAKTQRRNQNLVIVIVIFPYLSLIYIHYLHTLILILYKNYFLMMQVIQQLSFYNLSMLRLFVLLHKFCQLQFYEKLKDLYREIWD